MKLVALTLVLAGISLAGLASPRPAALQQLQPGLLPLCQNPLPHEPLVVYEVTGGTLVGPLDGLLAVYSDGLARYSSSLGDGPGFAYTVHVGLENAAELRADLLAAGAARQCDQSDLWNDVPLSTLSVLRSAARQHGNTFSWWIAEGEVVAIEDLLEDFITSHFPVAPPSGGS